CSSPSFAATIRKLLTRRRLRCLKVLRTWWGYTAREGVTREQVAPLKKTSFRKSPLTYVMKLTSPVRSGLIGGIVDFVVAHDLPQLTSETGFPYLPERVFTQTSFAVVVVVGAVFVSWTIGLGVGVYERISCTLRSSLEAIPRWTVLRSNWPAHTSLWS